MSMGSRPPVSQWSKAACSVVISEKAEPKRDIAAETHLAMLNCSLEHEIEAVPTGDHVKDQLADACRRLLRLTLAIGGGIAATSETGFLLNTSESNLEFDCTLRGGTDKSYDSAELTQA